MPIPGVHPRSRDVTGEGGQEFMGAVCYRGPVALASVRVQADLDRCPMCKILWTVEGSFAGLKGMQGAFEEFWNIVAQGWQRNRGPLELIHRFFYDSDA
jgi:hypothetical protein